MVRADLTSSLFKFHHNIFDEFEMSTDTTQSKGLTDKTFGSTHHLHELDFQSSCDGDVENASQFKEAGLKRELDGRHLRFLALGSGIGTGLFVGSANILVNGGPASLMINFIITGLMIITVIFAIGEMVAAYPMMSTYSTIMSRFVDPSIGFSIGICYLMTWLIILPVELTAATIVISFWDVNEVVPKGVWIAIIIVGVFSMNMIGVRVFGEFEFAATTVKMISIVGFIICAIVIDCGGAPNHHYFGAGTWHNPGSFRNGFKGFCSSFAFAGLAYGGTEIVGISAAEAFSPRLFLPKVAKYVVYRVVFFYLLPLFLITLLVPYDHSNLQNGSSGSRASPFVIAIQAGKIYALPKIFNAVILISVISVTNAAVYAGSRLILSMTESKFLPKFLGYMDRSGRPIAAYCCTFAFALLGFLTYSASEDVIFDWLGTISGLSEILLWAALCLAHLRFRLACKRQKLDIKILPWVSPLGIYGSIFGFIINILLLVATFYTAAFPFHDGAKSGEQRANSFFKAYLSGVIMIVAFVSHKIITRSRFVRTDEIDLVSGRRDPVTADEIAAEKRKEHMTTWERVVNYLF